MFKRQLSFLLKSVLIFVVVAFCGQIAVVLSDPAFEGQVNLIAPVFGVAMGVMLVGGFRYIPAIVLGAWLPPYYAESGLLIALGLPLGVIVSGLVGVLFVRLTKVDLECERIRDTFLIMLLGTATTSLCGAFVETVFYACSIEDVNARIYRDLFLSNWLAAGVGSIIVLPFILTWADQSGFRLKARQLFEVMVWFATLIIFGLVTFQSWAPTDTLLYPMELAIFPILAWAAIRFGLRGASAGVLVLALLAAWQLIPVLGPEARYISQSPSNVWIFVGIVSVTSICLASVMTELRLREAQIIENESRLLAFTSALPDIAFVLSGKGMIDDVFAATKQIQANHRIFNVQTVKGKQIEDLFDSRVAKAFMKTLHHALETYQVQTLEYALESVDVGEHWFEARVSPMSSNVWSEPRVVWVAYDITSRKRFESAMKRQDKLLNATARANSLLLTIPKFETALETALGQMCSGLGAQRGMVCVIEAGSHSIQQRFRLRYQWKHMEVEELVDKDLGLDLDQCFPGWYERLLAGEALHGRNVINHELNHFNLRSPLLIPMILGGQLYGFLGVDYAGENREWLDSEINAVRVMASSISGILLIQAREDDLRIARDQANAANSAKGEFLAVMSHEIRTPMNAMLGYTDLLAQSDLTLDQKGKISIIKRSGKALLDLINNILDYSKIESRAIELESREFNLEHVMCESLEICLPLAQEKSLELDYKIGPGVKRSYLGDAHRLKQILLNLANNALKFTEVGGVSLFVDLERNQIDGNGEVLHFKVVDTGIGISDAQIARLFEAFVQADSSTTREFGGTGLGLVISKRLVERMEGRIWVESEQGDGSTFHVLIPFKYSEDITLNENFGSDENVALKKAAPKSDSLDEKLAARCPLKILVCEDNDVNRALICKVLERFGYSPFVAEDGHQAIDMIHEQNFELILMDVRMPGFDGVKVTNKIRSREEAHGLPRTYIIAVTAYAMSEDRAVCIDSGMDDYLSKPIDMGVLQNSLSKAYRHLKSVG